jgi:hypothetical protein
VLIGRSFAFPRRKKIMAEPTGLSALLGDEVMVLERNESNHAEKNPNRRNSASEKGVSGCANDIKPDPLALLPEHFRKEIEEQSIISSRKVSFKVIIATRL